MIYPIPYCNNLSRINLRKREIMRGYFYEEVVDHFQWQKDGTSEQISVYQKAVRCTCLYQIKTSISKARQDILNHIASPNRTPSYRFYKGYHKDSIDPVPITFKNIQLHTIQNLYQLVDNYQNRINVCMDTEILGYDGWKRVKDLNIGNFMRIIDKMNDKPLYSQIVEVIHLGRGPTFTIETHEPDHHIYVNGIILRSSTKHDTQVSLEELESRFSDKIMQETTIIEGK